MGRQIWSGMLAMAVGLVITFAIAYGLALTDMPTIPALMWGWLSSAVICLSLGIRRYPLWGTFGSLELGGALVTAMIWQGISNWWWPLGLVVLGLLYLVLAESLPTQIFSSWRAAFGYSTLLLSSIGAIWEIGQIAGLFLLRAQAIPLPGEDSTALRTSFLISSILLVAGSLFWGLMRHRLIALALTAVLVAQLAIAGVLAITDPDTPSLTTLLALALLAVALISHAGTYLLRFTQPALTPGKLRLWLRLFDWPHRPPTFKEAIFSQYQQEAWWLCLLLDSFALLLCLIAAIPIARASAADIPDEASLMIVLGAGCLLSLSIAYWQNIPWYLLLAGFFLGSDLLIFGRLSSNATLLYLIAAIALLWLAVWLNRSVGRSWALAALLVAIGYGVMALACVFQSHNLAWEPGGAPALPAPALLTLW